MWVYENCNIFLFWSVCFNGFLYMVYLFFIKVCFLCDWVLFEFMVFCVVEMDFELFLCDLLELIEVVEWCDGV